MILSSLGRKNREGKVNLISDFVFQMICVKSNNNDNNNNNDDDDDDNNCNTIMMIMIIITIIMMITTIMMIILIAAKQHLKSIWKVLDLFVDVIFPSSIYTYVYEGRVTIHLFPSIYPSFPYFFCSQQWCV